MKRSHFFLASAMLAGIVLSASMVSCGGSGTGGGDAYVARLTGGQSQAAPSPTTLPTPTSMPASMPTQISPAATPVVLARIEQQPTPVIVGVIVSDDNYDVSSCRIVDTAPYQVDGQTFTQRVVCEEVQP